MKSSLTRLISILMVLGYYPVVADNIIQPDIKLTTIVASYSDLQQFGNPTGIFFDAIKYEIYLADSGNHQVGIFDMKGTSIWSFKHWVDDSRANERVLGDPRSIVVNSAGDIIISDNRADYLDVIDYRGGQLQKIEPKDYDNIDSFRGSALAIDSAGNIYVGTVTTKPEILKFDPDFRLLFRFGEKGDSLGGLNNISGIWAAEDGRIFVSDIFSIPAIKIFSAEGKFISGFGDHMELKTDFSYPAGIAVTRGGRVWIVDSIRQVVKCLTEDGEFITMIGGFGSEPGDMKYPSSVASDGDTLLVVAEKNGNRYQQFVIK